MKHAEVARNEQTPSCAPRHSSHSPRKTEADLKAMEESGMMNVERSEEKKGLLVFKKDASSKFIAK